MVSGNEKSIDSLYNVYSKSIDYDKIIAFESDFSNGDKGGKLAQFSAVNIKPFRDYIICAYKFNSDNKSQNDNHFVDATLSHINENKQLNGLRLVYMPADFSNENYQSYLNDSIIETISDKDLRTFLKGISNYEIYNYQHAENHFNSLIGNPIYDIYANINIASLQKEKAELVLINQNYNDPITINYKKSSDNKSDIAVTQSKPNYQDALNSISLALKKNSSNPFIWYNMGNLHLQMQEFHKAIDDYTQAIKYEKNLAEA